MVERAVRESRPEDGVTSADIGCCGDSDRKMQRSLGGLLREYSVALKSEQLRVLVSLLGYCDVVSYREETPCPDYPGLPKCCIDVSIRPSRRTRSQVAGYEDRTSAYDRATGQVEFPPTGSMPPSRRRPGGGRSSAAQVRPMSAASRGFGSDLLQATQPFSEPDVRFGAALRAQSLRRDARPAPIRSFPASVPTLDPATG